MKEFIRGMYDKPHFWKRLILCFIAVCIMGFCVSWLNFINWGTDPCSVMNFGISNLLGLSFGNWQAILNVCLFVIVVWKDKSNIGFGTIFNMFLVGYSCDFMTWIRINFLSMITFESVIVKAIAMLAFLLVFVFAVAVYLSVELGTAPYDAISFILANSQSKLPFKVVRIIWDCVITLIGFLAGGTVGIVTIIMAFTIGPAASLVQGKIKKFLE